MQESFLQTKDSVICQDCGDLFDESELELSVHNDWLCEKCLKKIPKSQQSTGVRTFLDACKSAKYWDLFNVDHLSWWLELKSKRRK